MIIKKMNQIFAVLTRISGVISCAVLFLIMALITADVLYRFITNASILGSYELVQMAMTIMVFFAFPYGQYKKALIRIDFIIQMLPIRARYVIWAVGDIISTAVCYMLAYCAYLQAGIMYLSNARTSILLLRTFWFYYSESAALLLFALMLTYDMIKSVGAIFNESCAKEIRAQWGMQ